MNSTQLLPALLARTESIAFLGKVDNQFELISDIPRWARATFPEINASGDELNITGKFEFLDFFLDEARAHWQSGKHEVLYSDEWVETFDESHDLPMIAIAATVDGHPLLLLRAIERQYNARQKVYQHARESLLNNELLEAEVRKRTRMIRQREEEISMRLLSAAAERDQETGLHVRRIGLYAAAFAKELGWSADQIDEIKLAAPMHDVGKIGVPDSILLKPGKLEPEELSIMRKHVLTGSKILSGTDIPMMKMAHDIALYHHERWDGKGYPYGLKGDEIPQCARIVSIVDVYDALSTRRIYKPSYSEEETLRMMQEQKGKHFEPYLLDVFMKILSEVLQIKLEFSEPEAEWDLSRLTGSE